MVNVEMEMLRCKIKRIAELKKEIDKLLNGVEKPTKYDDVVIKEIDDKYDQLNKLREENIPYRFVCYFNSFDKNDGKKKCKCINCDYDGYTIYHITGIEYNTLITKFCNTNVKNLEFLFEMTEIRFGYRDKDYSYCVYIHKPLNTSKVLDSSYDRAHREKFRVKVNEYDYIDFEIILSTDYYDKFLNITIFYNTNNSNLVLEKVDIDANIDSIIK